MIAPVMLAGLAVLAPLAMAGETIAPAEARASVAMRSGDRADSLVEIVSQAARQFCGEQVAMAPGLPVGFDVQLPAAGMAFSPPALCPMASPRLAPRLLDLPPPTL